MSWINKTAAGVVMLLVTAPLAAQDVVLSGFGGGYSALADLDGANGSEFRPGLTVGGATGIQLSERVGVHLDLAWSRAVARGDVEFAAVEFSRFFFGSHVELRFPLAGTQLAPFMFLGGGLVIIHPERSVYPSANLAAAGPVASPVTWPTPRPSVRTFTEPAALFGVGTFYPFKGHMDLFVEAKTVTYRWIAGGYDKTAIDLTYVVGMSYRFPLR